MNKTTLVLGNDHYELELHGVIHVSKNGSYNGCIEFAGGFGPVTYKMVQSAIEHAVEYFGAVGPETTSKVAEAIRRIMKPAPIAITNQQMGLIYAGLCCGASIARENGHTSDANEFDQVFQLLDAARLSDFNFQIVPSQ
jgi:hypothetical protein